MYPMTLICRCLLSTKVCASTPHVLVLSGCPPVPNPILESQLSHSCSSLSAMIPILALELLDEAHAALNPSFSQLRCREPWGPSRLFHASRPTEVARYCSSAISEYSESAVLSRVIKFAVSSPGIFMPRQILVNGVFQ